MPQYENITNICLHEALSVINEAILLLCELEIHTASVISSVLTQTNHKLKQ